MTQLGRSSVAAAALVTLVGFGQAPRPDPGFTSLFNGVDFAGWRLTGRASLSLVDGREGP